MLTREGGNAFLKMLEEPPEHVVFILATTEPHKLLPTIVSRCQHFQFRRPSEEVLTKFVEKVTKSEGFEIDKDAASLIATLGDGSYRDTLTFLQQTILTGKKSIERPHVEKISGAPKMELVHDMVLAIVARDVDTSLATVHNAESAGLDLKVFLKLCIREIREALLIALSPKLKEVIKGRISDSRFEAILELSKKGSGSDILPKSLTELLLAYEQMSHTPTPELPLELALCRILTPTS